MRGCGWRLWRRSQRERWRRRRERWRREQEKDYSNPTADRQTDKQTDRQESPVMCRIT